MVIDRTIRNFRNRSALGFVIPGIDVFAIIYRNLFFDELRRRKIVSFCTLDEEEQIVCQPATRSAFGDIDAMLSELCPEEREALFLHEVEGYTASEISRLTGQPRGTVLSLMHRARQRLLKLAQNERKRVWHK